MLGIDVPPDGRGARADSVPLPYLESAMNRKWYIGTGAIAAVAAGWILFRPELLFVNARANEAFPSAAATQPAAAVQTGPASAAAASAVLARGNFHSVAHESKGTATIHRLDDGTRVLRFTEFMTSNGPALRAYLLAADGAGDSVAVTTAGFVDLGALKGNVGDQNYEIPGNVD